VLIVDESAESREILSALLARHGASTIEAHCPNEAAELADRLRPNLILFDADSDHTNSAAATRSLKDAANRIGTPIVILGTVQNARKLPPSDQFFAKPYHYGPLIRKIEDLLAAG
jgi:CheY-like chemotaxis protein